MTTKDYAIGAERWPGLSKLIEEAGEVVQVAGKILGIGGERRHWDGTDLKPRLEQELGDLIAAAHFVIAACGLDPAACQARYEEKMAKFKQWHADQGGVAPYSSEFARMMGQVAPATLSELQEERAYAEQARRSAAATRPTNTFDQTKWLEYARAKGYDEGFTAAPCKALLSLEREGLVERNPTSSGASTHWRVTEAGRG